MSRPITEHIYFIGVNDFETDLFEAIWPLPDGVSYNSYLILDDKITVIDTVKKNYIPDFMKNIQSIIGDKPIDYLVVNHMEPDHSGAVVCLLKLYPDSCEDTFWFFTDIFRHLFLGVTEFPGNLYRNYRGRNSRIDIWDHFLKALCRTGIVTGRIRAQGRKEDGTISRLHVAGYLITSSVIRCKGLLLHLKAALSHENPSCK